MNGDVKIVSINDSWMNVSSSKGLYVELMETWIDFSLWFFPTTLIINMISKYRFLFGFFLIIPFFLQTLLRRYSKNLVVYLLMNVLMIAITVAAFPALYEKIVYGALLTFRFIFCLKSRYSEKVEYRNFGFLIYNIVEFLVLTMFLSIIKMLYMNVFITTAAVNNIIFVLVYINITRTDNLMKWEGTYLGKFKNKIKRSKMFITAVILIVLTASNIFFWESGLYSQMDLLQAKIFSVFRDNKNIEKQETKLPDNKNVDTKKQNNANIYKNYKHKNSIVLNTILKIAEVIIYFLIAILLIYFLWLIILKLKELYNEFTNGKPSSDEEKESLISTKDVTSLINDGLLKIRRNTRDIFDTSNNKKIRKNYYRLVKKNSNSVSSINSSDTPFEIKETMEQNTGKEYMEITELYEKARYGSVQCSEKDVQAMKNLSKGL